MNSSRLPRTRPTLGPRAGTPARVPTRPRSGFDEPARFRLVHHAEVISLKGDSYRLKNRDLGRVPAAETNNDHQ